MSVFAANLPHLKCNSVPLFDVVHLDSFNGDYDSRGQSSAEVDGI